MAWTRDGKVELFEQIRRWYTHGVGDSGHSQDVKCSSTYGAPGVGECDATGTQEAGAAAAEAGAP